MQTTQTKVEYTGKLTPAEENVTITHHDDSINRIHPNNLPINSNNYRLHQRDRVNRFTTTTSSSSSNSSETPIDLFSSTFEAVPHGSSSHPSTPSTKSDSFTTDPRKNNFLSNDEKQQSTDYKRTDDDLLQWKDMPEYLQFNPYVLTGYRPLTNFKGCCVSLFYWHNETVNILTHAIPIVYILAIVPGLMPWDKDHRFLSFCHVFGSVAPWCGSFIYHLFMNIKKGENLYYILLKLDMLGIWISQSFGALPMVTATAYCFNPALKWFILISYCLVALWGLYKALTATSPWQRRMCFALPFTMRSMLTLSRTMEFVPATKTSLTHIYLQDAVSIVGGAIGAMRIPEKWFPGLVDYYLNSHNIMHVLVVVAVYSMHQATVSDLEWISKHECNVPVVSNSSVNVYMNSNLEL